MPRGQDEVFDFFRRKGGYDLLKALEAKEGRWKDIEKVVLVSPRTLSRRISEAMQIGLIKRIRPLSGGTAYRLTDKGRNALTYLAREKARESYIMRSPKLSSNLGLLMDLASVPPLMYFPRCPVCHGLDSKLKQIRKGRKDYLLCFSCGAKWHLKLKRNGSFQEAKLVAEGADGQGADLLRESHEPDFWLRQALKGSTPWPKEKSRRKG